MVQTAAWLEPGRPLARRSSSVELSPPLLQELALRLRRGQRYRRLVGDSGLVGSSQPAQELCPRGMEMRVGLQNPQAPFESNQPNPFGPANKMAKEYGLKVCGQG